MAGLVLRWNERVVAQVRDDFAGWMAGLGGTILVLARAYCPVRSGRLRGSLELHADPAGLTFAIGTDVEYASQVHERNPFLERAVTEVIVTAAFLP
jgi:hypothetical protein